MTTPNSGTESERTLVLLRHSKAEHVGGKLDHDRELAPRGRKDARAVGQWLGDSLNRTVPDLVLCSTAERTRQTLDGVLAGGTSVKEVVFDERIYDANASRLLDVLRELPDSVHCALMIGHAPGIPILATALVKEPAETSDAVEALSQGYPTSGLLVLTFKGHWAELSPETAQLREFVVPRG
jgi:phosphohistidine phosphatase